jgi:hypothetical protein
MSGESAPIKKVDHRRLTLRLFKEQVERQRISDDLRYDNLLAFIEIQESTIEDLKKRVEQLEAEDNVHPLKKLLKHYSLFI